MKKILMFAAAFMLFAATSCDEVVDDLLDDDGVEQGDTDTDSDSDSLTDDLTGTGEAGQVKTIKVSYPDDDNERDLFEYMISYDDEGRITTIEGGYSFYSYSEDIEPSSVASRAESVSVSRASQIKRSPFALDYATSTASTRATEIVETYISVKYTYDYSEDGVVTATMEMNGDDYEEYSEWSINVNSDGSYSDYKNSFSGIMVYSTYNDETDEWEVKEEIPYTCDQDYEYVYSNGYLDYVECLSVWSDDEDGVYHKHKDDFDWSDGNISAYSEYYLCYPSYNYYELEDKEIYTYGSDLNNTSIDLVWSFTYGGDSAASGMDRIAFGEPSKNLLESAVELSYNNGEVYSACARKYEYTYTDSKLTKMTCYRTNWADSEAEIDTASYYEWQVVELTYYE